MILWIASYPKSGNTWLRAIVQCLLKPNIDNEMLFQEMSNNIRQFPLKMDFKELSNIIYERRNYNNNYLLKETIKNWIPVQRKINKDKNVKIFKTHNVLSKINLENKDYNFTDLENTIGVLHVVRDPRTLVSSIKNHFYLKTEEESLEMLFNKNMWSGFGKNDVPTLYSSWSNHYNSWKRFPRNNLLIKYEDMLNDGKNQIIRIIKFLDNLKSFKLDDVNVENVINKTSFKNLKYLEKKGKFIENVIDKNTKKKIDFFNLGPENKWEKILKVENVNRIEKEFNSEMKELNYIS